MTRENVQLTGNLEREEDASKLPVAERELLELCRLATLEDQARVAHELPVDDDVDGRF